MAKEQAGNAGNASKLLKIVLGIVSLVSTIFICGMAYSYHNSRITTTEVAVVSLVKADSAIKEDLEAHEAANLKTEKEMIRKHEAMLERQHQSELMVQRQLTVSETLATGQSEAKQERKEDRAVLMKMAESVIKIQTQVENLERAD